MAWSKLVSMELDDEDKLDMCLPCGPDMKPKGPDYPYGLQICLTDKELAKLDLDVKDAQVGDYVDLRAYACIRSISENDGPNGKTCRVELQMEKLAIESESQEEY